ncbi:amino acid aldolase [Reticulibacter mediterranei]|uniref:Amino acid aldolase n=2 Tax=Reticulibacter mediterranei TaxID=2778369 RepID=A0A8J3IQZ7_9CHLR|nr:amino acid deaminase/aldolase [Reticulibacter mediterranei]GHO95280.1 amino acid aldolase [Reticulibacter mediterranei]
MLHQKHEEPPAGTSIQAASSPSPATIDESTTQARDYHYYKKVFAGRQMPFAFVDLDVLDQNIHAIAARTEGKQVRLPSKSLRSVAILKRILAANARFQGIMCFTAREAVYLASQGFQDLLLGYPIWHEQDIAAVAQANGAGSDITLMVDSLDQIEQAERVAQKYGVQLPLCLDIDMSSDFPGLHFGVWRSSLRTSAQVRPLIEHILASSHVQLVGLMGYESQIAGVGDAVPRQMAKNMLVRWLKERSRKELAVRRAEIVELIKSYGVQLRFVNGGGTGSIATTRQEEVVTEITVGSGFYSPALFDNFHEFRYQPAAGYAIEIIRRPSPTLYTCQGGGYIASGDVGLAKQPQPYLPAGARLTPFEGAGEVQTPIRYTGPLELHMGDPIFMRHAKAGELCERFTRLLLVSNGAIVDEVTTYRGDGQCFI